MLKTQKMENKHVNLKIDKGPNRHVTKEDLQVAYKYLK